MLTTLLITLFLGITLGLLLATLTLQIIKVKCPQCKKFKPLKEIDLRTKQGVFTYLIKKRSCYLEKLKDKISKLQEKAKSVEQEIREYQQQLELEKESKI